MSNDAIIARPADYKFMQIHAVDEQGATVNEKFFIGPLPKEGDAVEMVFVGSEDSGALNFQLRIKRPA